jgi:hypothetical protein
VRRGIHINRWRVVEERGGKEMDGCPLTDSLWHDSLTKSVMDFWGYGK